MGEYMDRAKNYMGELGERAQAVAQDVGQRANALGENIASSAEGVRDNVSSSVGDFSSQGIATGASEFVNSNSIVSKFVFIILVLIAFMFVVNLGIKFLGYMTSPPSNPYLIYGMIPGNLPQHISQDPKSANSAVVMRSNNENTGLEFTWSVWLLVTGSTATPQYSHVFNKGNNTYDKVTGIATVNNGPGMYIDNTANGNLNLHIVMDNNNAIGNAYSPTAIDISGVPLNKWFNVVVRMENIMVDTYINGTIANRTKMTSVPNQNYYDVFICQNGGFVGNLSNLRYYQHALSVFDINNIVIAGPNTTLSSIISNATSSAYPYYFANMWYTSKI